MTVAIENVTATVQDVSVQVMDQSLLKLSSLEGGVGSKNATATYVFTGGDANDETTVTIKVSYDSKTDVKRTSIRLTTIEDNDVTGEHVRRPIEAVIAWNSPGPFIADPAQTLALIGQCFGLCYASLSTKVPQPATINSIDRFLPGAVWG